MPGDAAAGRKWERRCYISESNLDVKPAALTVVVNEIPVRLRLSYGHAVVLNAAAVAAVAAAGPAVAVGLAAAAPRAAPQRAFPALSFSRRRFFFAAPPPSCRSV